MTPWFNKHLHRLSTPRAAALAGVLFAVLFQVYFVLIRTALPEGAEPAPQWVDGVTTRLRVAFALMPFAGIAFLWFIGVVRDGFGRYEDRFFSSVFLGSGILFLAMMFVSKIGRRCRVDRQPGWNHRRHRLQPCRHVRADGVDGVEQDVRRPDGSGVHDVVGDDLAEDGSDAAPTGVHDLPCRGGTSIAGHKSMWIVLAFPLWVFRGQSVDPGSGRGDRPAGPSISTPHSPRGDRPRLSVGGGIIERMFEFRFCGTGRQDQCHGAGGVGGDRAPVWRRSGRWTPCAKSSWPSPFSGVPRISFEECRGRGVGGVADQPGPGGHAGSSCSRCCATSFRWWRRGSRPGRSISGWCA